MLNDIQIVQNVVGIHSPGLDGRELVKSGAEDGAVFHLSQYDRCIFYVHLPKGPQPSAAEGEHPPPRADRRSAMVKTMGGGRK